LYAICKYSMNIEIWLFTYLLPYKVLQGIDEAIDDLFLGDAEVCNACHFECLFQNLNYG
jgi:hypothetical protein